MVGSSGATIVTTNQNGVYEVSGLPLDRYAVQVLDVPVDQLAVERKIPRDGLIPGVPLQLDLATQWDGVIEGSVVDAFGKPVRTLIELDNLSETPAAVIDAHLKDPGVFRFENLPPGNRDLLKMNSIGPTKDAPYNSERRSVEIARGGPRQKTINFVVHPLSARMVKIRVAGADGKPIRDAEVYIAYEGTEYWDDLKRVPGFSDVDANGLTNVTVWGNARVRIFAERVIEDKPRPPWYTSVYSKVAEFEADEPPNSLDLVVASKELER